MVLPPEASKNTLCQQVHGVGKSPNLQKERRSRCPVLPKAHLHLQLLGACAAHRGLGLTAGCPRDLQRRCPHSQVGISGSPSALQGCRDAQRLPGRSRHSSCSSPWLRILSLRCQRWELIFTAVGISGYWGKSCMERVSSPGRGCPGHGGVPIPGFLIFSRCGAWGQGSVLRECLDWGPQRVCPASLICDSMELVLAAFSLKVLQSFWEPWLEQAGVSFSSGTKQVSPGNAACVVLKI